MGKNYYRILGLSKDASDDDIKQAYRKLVLRYHPDKNKDHDAGERFKEVVEAYNLLTITKKRDVTSSNSNTSDTADGKSKDGTANERDKSSTTGTRSESGTKNNNSSSAAEAPGGTCSTKSNNNSSTTANASGTSGTASVRSKNGTKSNNSSSSTAASVGTKIFNSTDTTCDTGSNTLKNYGSKTTSAQSFDISGDHERRGDKASDNKTFENMQKVFAEFCIGRSSTAGMSNIGKTDNSGETAPFAQFFGLEKDFEKSCKLNSSTSGIKCGLWTTPAQYFASRKEFQKFSNLSSSTSGVTNTSFGSTTQSHPFGNRNSTISDSTDSTSCSYVNTDSTNSAAGTFSNVNSNIGSSKSGCTCGFGGTIGNLEKIQDPPRVHDLYVSLEDITRGCVKNMKISRRVLQPDGTYKKEDKVLSINVKPGWKAGTKITFHKEGDQGPNNIPADIVYVIRDMPHLIFTREGSDIKYLAEITLKQALCGTTIYVPTLTSLLKMVDLEDEIVTPHTVKRFPGYGLPLPKEPKWHGDLVVMFDIRFPKYLSSREKNILRKSLKDFLVGTAPPAKPAPMAALFFGSGKQVKASSNVKNDTEVTRTRCTCGASGTSGKLYKTSNGEVKTQDPPIIRYLPISLEGIARGCVKEMKICRKVLQPDGTYKQKDKVLTINVKPGWKAGTKITFHKEGDQGPNNIPADIVYIITDMPHLLFTRAGSDIKYVVKITLKQALCGTTINVPTMSATTKVIDLHDEVVTPHTVKRFPGYGLPLPKQPAWKGDLIVVFDIEFPIYLSIREKRALNITLKDFSVGKLAHMPRRVAQARRNAPSTLKAR